MNMKNLEVIVVMTAVIMLLAISGCAPARSHARSLARVGELQTRSESIALDGSKTERVDIFMGAGELDVSGGASELLQAKFTYNVAELEPQVKHSGGTLSVRTPDAVADVSSLWKLADYRYEWDVHLNDNVPMEMHVDMGPGNANLKLGSLSLTRLDLDTGVGLITVDLTGSWQEDLDARINGGLGALTVRLPGNACVRVDVEGGLGNVNAQGLTKAGNDYVNNACGESGATLRIDIAAGVGNINLEVVE